jgi:hypothetical protein
MTKFIRIVKSADALESAELLAASVVQVADGFQKLKLSVDTTGNHRLVTGWHRANENIEETNSTGIRSLTPSKGVVHKKIAYDQ